MIDEEGARALRCCGPEGCGTLLMAAGTSEKHFRYCVGSKCMAWRKHDQIGIGPDGKKRDRDMDGRTKWIDRGYCGLAGNPAQS